MTKPSDMRAARAVLVDQAGEIGSRAAAEKRDFTPEERGLLDNLLERSDAMAKDISRLERMEANAKDTTAPGSRVSEPLPHEIEESRGKPGYSILAAIKNAAVGKERGQKLGGLEGEVSQEIARRTGKNPQGFFMPSRLSSPAGYGRMSRRSRLPKGLERRTIDDTSSGAGAVMTRWDSSWIEFLRARLVMVQAGAKTLNDMHGNFALPRQSGQGTITWGAESAAVASTYQTIDQVLFTPKTAGAYTDMSRRFLEQLSIDAEMFARDDLAKVLARGIETAGFNGAGAPAPTGILQNSNITQVVALGANGGAPTWQSMVQLEELVGKANADMGSLAYIGNAAVRGTLKQTPKNLVGQTSTFPTALWNDEDEVNNYPIFTTNLVPSNLSKGSASGTLSALMYGNWEEAVFAFWSGQDVLVDPYTGGAAGTVRVIILQDLDFEVLHPQSFAYIADMITS